MKYSFDKTNQDPLDNTYTLEIVGSNFDNVFTYNLNLDIKNY